MHRKKSSSSNPPYVDGKHNLTSLQLCEGDDLATTMTVDAVLGFTTHKMDKNFNPSLTDKKLREKWKEIMQEFIVDLNYENAYSQLIASDKIKSNLKRDERFKRHIFRFLYLFDKRSGIEVSPCFRYENEGRRGAAIFATKEWERGSQISTLFGCIAEMTPNEEAIFHESKNEFSVMYSTRKNCSQLWLGPAAYVNHDCKPNCRFTEGNDDSKMTLETLRDIHPGDELLIYYGSNFFGLDNAECECFTCELRDQGLFSRKFQNGVSHLSFASSASEMSVLRDDSRETNRRIVTRSSKLVADENGCLAHSRLLPHSARLKKSEDTYSLRVTYSRIDRVKRGLLSRTPPSSSPKCRRASLHRLHQPDLLAHVSRAKKDIEPTLLRCRRRRRSERHLDTQNLTLKLRKKASQPREYEPMETRALAKPGADANIFSRITQLYLSQPGPKGSATLDSPPFLSPWFCSSDKKRPASPKRVLKMKLKPRKSQRLRRSQCRDKCPPCSDDDDDDCVLLPETSSSDMPSYTTSSPTIPVLEVESDTDLTSNTTPPPQLVCELLEPDVPNSPNKGIVMKFSRVVVLAGRTGSKPPSLLP